MDLTVACAVKRIVATLSPQVTPPTPQIQYCYSYSYEILPTSENIQINDEIYTLFKFLPLRKIVMHLLKDPPSRKREILHVIYTTMHINN
jgi:hypothetical protein